MPITVMISLVVTVALFLISLLFRIAARLNLTLPLLYFKAQRQSRRLILKR